MPASILVGYATRYGSTREVAETIANVLREDGLAVDVQPLREVRTLYTYSAVILGAPLYMFHWHKDALRFLARHREALTELPVAVFVLGPTHIPHDEDEWRDSHAQIDKELARFPWFKPVTLEMMGGRYEPEKLRYPLRMFIGKEPASDLRDFSAIRAWATSIIRRLVPGGT